MADIVHSRMQRLYSGPRSIYGDFGNSLSQTFVTAELTLSTIALPASSDGTVVDYTGATTTLSIRVSGRLDAGWSISRVDSAGITSTLAGATVIVTGLTADSATVTITANKAGYDPISKVFAVSRVRQGSNGEPGVPGEDGASGDSVDIIFTRSVGTPTTLFPSPTTPSGWYSMVDSVPDGAGSIWTSIGKKPLSETNYVWQAPVLIEGSDGTNGVSIVEVTIFKRSAVGLGAPAGGSYNFATRSLTVPSGGWSTSVPVGTEPVYTSRAVVSSVDPDATAVTISGWTAPVVSFQNGTNGDNGTSGDSVDIVFTRATTQPTTPAASADTPAGWYSSVAAVPAGVGSIWSAVGNKPGAAFNYTWQVPLKVEGSDGAAGLSIVELTIFKRGDVAPDTPTGGTYNFTTRTLTLPAGWSFAVPTGSDPVYTSRAVVSSADPAATSVAPGAWSTPTVSFRDGEPGADGASGDSVDFVFRRSVSQPTTPTPSAGTPVDWYSSVSTVPAGAGAIWSSIGKKALTDSNYTWQLPVKIEGSDGASGLSIVELTIFKRGTSSSTPTGGTYNFATKVLTPPSTWSTSVPAGTDPVYTSRAVASSADPSATSVAVSGWSTSVVSFQNGATGPVGPTGSTGPRGTVNLIASGSSWSNTTADNAVFYATSSYTKQIGDIVTISNGSSFSQTRAWSGSSWIAATAYINGNMIVSGTLVADQVAAGTMTGSTIRTSSGSTRVELSAATNQMIAYIGGVQKVKIGGTSDAYVYVEGGTLPGIWAVGGAGAAIVGSNSLGNSGVEGRATGSGAAIRGYSISTGSGVYGSCDSSGIAVRGDNTGSGHAGKFVGPSGVDGAVYVQNNGTNSSSSAIKATNGNNSATASIAAGTWAVYANVGNIGPFTGSHDALVYPDFPGVLGDIVFDYEVVARNGVSDAITLVGLTQTSGQKDVVGIVATLGARLADGHIPAAFIGDEDPAYISSVFSNRHIIQINSLGEGQINVCGEGGDIEAGDLIVSSSLAGKGMRQSDDIVRSATVAKSREAVTFDSPTQVKQIACIYLCG